MNEFITWAGLGTYAGAVMMTTIITQFLKDIPAIAKMNAQIISYTVAVLLMWGSLLFGGGMTLPNAVLCAVNAVMVALASNGVYDAATAGTPAAE